MNIKTGLLAIPCVFLAACAGIRPYDGVVGYKARKAADGSLTVTYSDEDRRSWEELQAKATKVCSRELSLMPDALKVAVLEQRQLSKNVSFSIPITTGAEHQGRGSASGETSSATHFNEALSHPMKLKELSLSCAAR